MKYSFLLLATLSATTIFAQNRNDKGIYGEGPKNVFFDSITKSNEAFFKEKTEPNKRLMMDYSGIDVPKSISEFTIVTADKPTSQGNTGTCWCFSTTSFYESEIYRLHHKNISLSEMYTVYWQYVEKAKEYVRTRGASVFSEGSETNAVQNMMKKYGMVPHEDYTGLKPGQPFQDHSKMVAEMTNYLDHVKQSSAWNEHAVVKTIRMIMEHYIGTPPDEVEVNGKKYTPKEYLEKVAKLNPDDYVTFMSLKSEPMWSKAEYKVGDNWWHSKDYYNIPLDDFMNMIKKALENGYSIAIGGDVSEPGINSHEGLMMIPSFDIPSSYINGDARLMRFLNGSTTDDHAMHIIGYVKKSNGYWFLVKDSGSGGHNNKFAPGYWFMHEDYIKLKMMTATVHKDAVKELLSKIKP
jgi:bleomycin hydrolase